MVLHSYSRLSERKRSKNNASALEISPISKYWSSFKIISTLEEHYPINVLCFSPVLSDLTYTSRNNILICNGFSQEVKKKLSRNKDNVTCIGYRPDGRLLLAGNASGLVQLHDTNSRTIMRTLTGHSKSVRVVSFELGNSRVLTGSEDTTIRLWDLLGEKTILTFEGHTDYIKCLTTYSSNPDIFFSGSYDKTIRCWNMTTGETMAIFIHSDPVESVAIGFGPILYSAAGNIIYCWDLLMIGSVDFKSVPLFSYSPHQKTITGLVFDQVTKSILTCSIDHHVKIISVNPTSGKFTTERTFVYGNPLLSIAINVSGDRFAVGMSNGCISVRVRPSSTNQSNSEKVSHNTEKRIIVEPATLPKYCEIDTLLRSFQHKRALDVALASPSPSVITLLFEEFIRRGVLTVVLSEISLEHLQRVSLLLLQYSTDPIYSTSFPIVFETVLNILEMFTIKHPIELQRVSDLLIKLQLRIQEELSLQRFISSTTGALELLLCQF